jgi:hypothetical protein
MFNLVTHILKDANAQLAFFLTCLGVLLAHLFGLALPAPMLTYVWIVLIASFCLLLVSCIQAWLDSR